MTETTTNEGGSWYHSLQAKLEKRFANGHTASAAYTWSKLIEAVGLLNDMDPAPYRTISSPDYPHGFSESWIYELPFWRGRISGGWQVEGLCVFQSSSPLGFDNIIFRGHFRTCRCRRSGGPWSGSSTPRPGSSGTARRRWRSTCAPSRCASAASAAGDEQPGLVGAEEHWARRQGHRVWFANPNANPASSLFGVITAEQGYMRRVQLGVKLIY